MNYKSLFISRTAVLLSMFCAAHLSVPVRAAHSSELLEKGIYEEETKGDCAAAINSYQQILADQAADRSLVAQAELRLGLCQLKLGDKAKAFSTLEKLTQDFPDKTKLLTFLQPQMPA